MKYSLGLDIGTTSIGWAVIDEDKKRIEDCGVRIFETPENPNTGESLAKPRRDARSARRRLHRRRARLNYLKRYFINNKLLEEQEISNLLDPSKEPKLNPYELRARGIKEPLPNAELFIALYHIAKRRGYKSNRKKVEENDKKSDSSKVLSAIKDNQSLINKYGTVGSALYIDDKFSAHKRNKTDSYQNSFIRENFEAEARKILETQKWPKEKIDTLFHDPAKKWGGIFDQRPFMTEDLIKKMRGDCPLEKGEKRAWKASLTFELFRLAEDLSHLEYNHGNKLTPEQIQAVTGAAKTLKSGLSYKRVREIIGYKNASDFKFDYIRGKQKESYEETEKNKFCELKFYHAVKSAATEDDWKNIEPNAGEYGDEKVGLLDYIGYILTVNKDDKNVERELNKLPLSPETKNSLMSLSFSGFAHLSIKALNNLIPHLLNGKTYDKAVEAEYPGEFAAKLHGDKNMLPPLSESERNQLTNPVVKRAIGQTRKVINAIIKKYGSPYQIKIECANNLAKNFKDRRGIKRMQDENAERNQIIVNKLKELDVVTPSGQQIIKYKLRELQNCKCQYCGKPLGPEIFTDDKLAEIDHIIPFSRCGNDSLINKALVCSRCNQEKKNLTPFEKWGNTSRWETIENLACGTNIPYKKRDRILAEKVPKEEWRSHALNDTRFMTRFLANYIRKNLEFNKDYPAEQRIVRPTGAITNYLRKMYHLGQKDRELNNCHHAVDACIIATVSQGQIQKFSKWNEYKELGAKYSATIEGFDENEVSVIITKHEYEELTADLLPWERFDDEVLIRCGMKGSQEEIEDLQTFRDRFRDFKSYDEEFLNKIHPLVISRLPKRSAKGSAHEASLRSPRINSKGEHVMKIPLSKITPKNVNKLALEYDPKLHEQIKELLSKNNGKIPGDTKIYKDNKRFDKNSKELMPVRSVKIYAEKTGIKLNKQNGKYTQFATNGDMICVNVYRRKCYDGKYKYFVAPIYVNSINSEKIEILPTPNGRSKAEKEDYDSIKENGIVYAAAKNGFEKVVTVFPNDYIRIAYPDHIIEGYYVKYGISVGQIALIDHSSPDKGTTITATLGTATGVQLINISTLGDNYPWRGEPSQ